MGQYMVLGLYHLPRGASAITFDDGYADNHHVAKPLLERHEHCATVFLATGAIIEEREFWWDELGQIVLGRTVLPRELKLGLPQEVFTWILDEASFEPPAEIRAWRAWHGAPAHHGRLALYLALWQRLHALAHGPREAALVALSAWAGIEPRPRWAHRPLTVDEVAALATGDLVEIGAHTVSHPALGAIVVEEQQTEIIVSKSSVERLTGSPVRSFSYPHGSFTDETVGLIRAAGFATACTAADGPLSRTTDRFQLPRVTVPDCDGDAFAAEIMAGC